MGLIVDVPLNTAVADLDEVLRQLLTRELARHHFQGVEIAFDAPSKEWSGKLTAPTVNLFLYDLREAVERAEATPSERRANGQAISVAPPLRLELTFSVSAWTNAVEDEHRLLSQVLSILFSYRQLPDDLLEARAGGGPGLRETLTSVGRPREEKADFWTSVGGQYKASIDYVVHLTIESGATFVRGPEVRTQTMGTRQSDGPRGTVSEMHRFGGKVFDADGAPLRDVWVTLPELGIFAASDPNGRFVLQRVPSGTHQLVARTRDGAEATAEIAVPGAVLDLTVGPKKRAAKRAG